VKEEGWRSVEGRERPGAHCNRAGAWPRQAGGHGLLVRCMQASCDIQVFRR
jgi:hypothetical protein